MKFIGTNELREKYLRFFESKNHLRLDSFSLVPKNDKSLLLINAGMAPLKPYFTGVEQPPSKRVTTCQKCIRTGDIENVGKTSRHATFFEMLGNFSFGDYFKGEIIPWAWEFITDVLEIPKDKLYVTIYQEDDEAFEIWKNKTDIDTSRIFRLGKEDNFWEIGVGPCGPCTEIHFDRGEGKIETVEDFLKASDRDRVVEFWNLVFTQFDKNEQGDYNRLTNPNIDTGMGLERIATIMQEVDNIFEIDTIKNILNRACKLTNTKYGKSLATDISLRIITDHAKSITILICDGVQPSNEGRGYVLRRLLRRAARHGRLIGAEGIFLNKMVDAVVENYGGAYPELKEKTEYIKKIIKLEEERFNETIDSGMDILKSYIDEMKEKNEKVLSGEKVFKLYDTFGFPLELTEEILEEKGLKLDINEFDKEMKAQRERARNAREETSYMGNDESPVNKIDATIDTEFDGYNKTNTSSKVLIIGNNEELKEKLESNEEGFIVTNVTSFYAEMGGQVGDTGYIVSSTGKALVLDCKKNIGGKFIHYIRVIQGSISINQEVTLEVDSKRRANICRNHTSTHLLHEALKEVIGEHVNQSGSYVDDERLRFDFTHFTALTYDELNKVENIINEKIMSTYKVVTEEMSISDAKKSGATCLFDEKYAEKVRVVSVGEFSKELCGGTHVTNSGEIGLFKIVSESGVAAGIRRIEAVTGLNAINFMNSKINTLKEISSVLKCNEKEILKKVSTQIQEIKEKEKEILELKEKLVQGIEEDVLKDSIDVNGVQLVRFALKDIDGNSLRDLGDKVRNKMDVGVVVLASEIDGKVQLIAMATKKAVQKDVHCGKIIKEIASIVGGGGGGRPDMAQAGGKIPSMIEEALEKSQEVLENLVK